MTNQTIHSGLYTTEELNRFEEPDSERGCKDLSFNLERYLELANKEIRFCDYCHNRMQRRTLSDNTDFRCQVRTCTERRKKHKITGY